MGRIYLLSGDGENERHHFPREDGANKREVFMNYGKAILLVRTARGLTQQDLAKQAELNSSYISLLEKGHRKPGTKALESLTKAMRVPMYLFMLLASEEDDLEGLPKHKADELAGDLLQIVIHQDHA